MRRPGLLVDVDGVLNPFLGCNKPRPECPCHPGWLHLTARPPQGSFRLSLNPAHGPALLELAADTRASLMWATTWQEEANTWVGPHVGLPELPVVPIPPRPRWGRDSVIPVGVWKARHVAEWADGRPFAWFDDEPDVPQALRDLARIRTVPPHRVVTVDERTGLTSEHFAAARAWLSTL